MSFVASKNFYSLPVCRTALSRCIVRHYARIIRNFPVYPDDKPLDKIPEINYVKHDPDRRQLFSWGLCEHGGVGIQRQLTKRSKGSAPRFLQRPSRNVFGDLNTVADVACGYGFTLYKINTKSSNKVYGTGINKDSQIGYQSQRKDAPMELILSPAPIHLPIDSGENVIALAAGRAHSLVLVEKAKGKGGRVLSFGNNSYGQCGRMVDPDEDYTGSKVVHCISELGGAAISSITCGQDHSVFVNEKGEVFACGWGDDGQTGQNEQSKQEQPSRIKGDIEGEKIVKVSSVGDCNLAINDTGALFGWGNSEYSQLLKPNTTQIYAPVHINVPQIGKIIDIAAGGSFCCALNDQGQVWVWGFGLLGLGPNVTQCNEPQMIPETLLGQSDFTWKKSRIVSIEAGLFHLAAVSANGDLFTWGRNKDGCLGLGHTRDQPFPLRVSIGASVLKVSCGVDHMAAVCAPFF